MWATIFFGTVISRLTIGQCDQVDCDVKQWLKIANMKSGNITDLLELEKTSNVNNLISLHHDPFMFHQANLRKHGVNNTIVNGVSGNFSLLQMWVETIVAEFTRVFVLLSRSV